MGTPPAAAALLGGEASEDQGLAVLPEHLP
jgi:hypothetical protein